MTEASDMDLVREFARNHTETAFAELVRRHLNLVYSIARRCSDNDSEAQDVAQAVFVILARKATTLRAGTVLTGWLYETTRHIAARAQRTNARRHIREQEAYVQTTLTADPNASDAWQRLAPHLEAAMSQLGQGDRTLLALRFYENKSGPESAALLGIHEAAAHKRTARALEKLRKVFARRGVALSASAIAGAVSAHSVQAAPAMLAKAVTATALAAGATASTSTLTIIKGALKLMAWTKLNTAIVAGAIIVLAAGTTTVTVKEIQEHRTYAWQVQNVNSDVLRKVPPQVAIAPAKYPHTLGAGIVWVNDGGKPSGSKTIGIAQSLSNLVSAAYGQSDERTIFLAKVPASKFDYIANLPSGNEAALQQEIKRKFGLVAQRETRDTDCLLLEVENPAATGLKTAQPERLDPHSSNASRSGAGYVTFRNQPLSNLAWSLEYRFRTPVIDQTRLSRFYDLDLHWDESDFQHPNFDGLKQALLDQLGLELVPTNMPIEMLVVEKAK